MIHDPNYVLYIYTFLFKISSKRNTSYNAAFLVWCTLRANKNSSFEDAEGFPF